MTPSVTKLTPGGFNAIRESYWSKSNGIDDKHLNVLNVLFCVAIVVWRESTDIDWTIKPYWLIWEKRFVIGTSGALYSIWSSR